MNSGQQLKFPQYRKYKNNRSYFCINSAESFEEITVMGELYTLHIFTSKILPDRHLVNDLLYNYTDHWDLISEEEYQQIKSRV